MRQSGELDKLGIVIQALDLGHEVELAGEPLRLFRNGQVVLFPSGYYVLDEDRLLRRMRSVRIDGHDAQVYMDSDVPFNWLVNQARRLTEDTVRALAGAVSRTSWRRRHIAHEEDKAGGKVIPIGVAGARR